MENYSGLKQKKQLISVAFLLYPILGTPCTLLGIVNFFMHLYQEFIFVLQDIALNLRSYAWVICFDIFFKLRIIFNVFQVEYGIFDSQATTICCFICL